jgi:hypothetical protein
VTSLAEWDLPLMFETSYATSLEPGTVDSCLIRKLFDNSDSLDLYFVAVKITQKKRRVYCFVLNCCNR